MSFLYQSSIASASNTNYNIFIKSILCKNARLLIGVYTMSYSSKIANLLLITPYDNRANVADSILEKMSEEEFCNHCYSKPKFSRKTPFVPESDNYTDDDYRISTEDLERQRYNQTRSYENFNTWLSSFKNSTVYTINGNAGTGKTTFINHERYTNKSIEWIIMDIYRAPSHIEWISDISTDIKSFNKAAAKVYGCLLNKIQHLIFRQTDDDGLFSIDKTYKKLCSLSSNYKNKWSKYYPSGKTLMDNIVKILDNEEATDVQKVIKCAESFKKYFSEDFGPEATGTTKALNFLLLSIICETQNTFKKHIIVFDNFERFIGKNEIYNLDVDKIRLFLNDYIMRINDAPNIFKEKFKFAMAVRDSTARMCRVTIHAADTEPNNLDLNNWFDVENIIQLKKEWCKKENILIDNVDLIEQIIGDIRTCQDKTVTGLKLMLDPLFNNNKRLLIDFMGRIIELPQNSDLIDKYKSLWSDDTQYSRFAARSIIRGLVLYSIEQEGDHLFKHLKSYSDNRNINGLGEARKILTILYNHIENGEENEMSIASLLSILFNKKDVQNYWLDPKNSSQTKTISEILFYMNSYNRRENDWIQFVDIQYKNVSSLTDDSISVNNEDQLKEFFDKNMSNCTIHLMPAGRVYLESIVASFEFFSLRYLQHYKPLFSLIPTPSEIEKCKNVTDLQCYITINRVANYALKCIRTLKSGEDFIQLVRKNKDTGIWHRSRIKNQHISYIDAFILYLSKTYIDSDKLCTSNTIKDKYRSLCEKIILIKNQYKNY